MVKWNVKTCNTMVTTQQKRKPGLFIRDGVKVEHSDSKVLAMESASKLLDDCKSTAKRRLSQNESADVDASASILEELAACIQEGIAKEIETANEEIHFQAEIRKKMADSWENYTCTDMAVNATEPKKDGGTWRRKVV